MSWLWFVQVALLNDDTEQKTVWMKVKRSIERREQAFIMFSAQSGRLVGEKLVLLKIHLHLGKVSGTSANADSNRAIKNESSDFSRVEQRVGSKEKCGRWKRLERSFKPAKLLLQPWNVFGIIENASSTWWIITIITEMGMNSIRRFPSLCRQSFSLFLWFFSSHLMNHYFHCSIAARQLRHENIWVASLTTSTKFTRC